MDLVERHKGFREEERRSRSPRQEEVHRDWEVGRHKGCREGVLRQVVGSVPLCCDWCCCCVDVVFGFNSNLN